MTRFSQGRGRVLTAALLACLAIIVARPGESIPHLPVIDVAENDVLPEDLSSAVSIRKAPDGNAMIVGCSVRNTGKRTIPVPPLTTVRWSFCAVPPGLLGPYRPLEYRQDLWHGSTYWTGPDWLRVGKDWQHPGAGGASVRTFRLPRDGVVTVSGRPRKGDTESGGGDGVVLEIRHAESALDAGNLLWRAEIEGDDDQGLEHSVSITVRAGDSLHFIVRRRGTIAYDTTVWNPRVAYGDGDAFEASSGFSETRQGEGGWSYQMEPTPAAPAPVAAIHGWTLDCVPLTRNVAATEQMDLSDRDALPFFVVDRAEGDAGIIVALGDHLDRPWELQSGLSDAGSLEMKFRISGLGKAELAPGELLCLPEVLLAPYSGRWREGVGYQQELLEHAAAFSFAPALPSSARELTHSLMPSGGGVASDMCAGFPDFEFWTMIIEDWLQQDAISSAPDYERAGLFRTAARQHLGKARRLLKDLRRQWPKGSFQHEEEEMSRLVTRLQEERPGGDQDVALYLRTRWAKRRIALRNPLLDFDEILFCKRVPSSYSHLVMQYFGWRARPGGGLFILKEPGYSLETREILGKSLPPGSILEPRLSYDGQRIVFSFVECGGGPNTPEDAVPNAKGASEGYYHIYSIGADGAELRQLTDGPYDDLMPCWLPDGDIIFSSTRRGGYARCFGAAFGRRWHVYTLHRMDSHGENLRLLSCHDTNEWFPTVSNTGQVLYARWDYIDRDAVTHQNLWAMRPDGTNPAALWGNATSSPHCAFQAQPVPDSNKIVFTASAHHSITGGSIVVLDPSVDNNSEEALSRITPEVHFPEAESRDIQEYYCAPWPLSDNYFLVAYSPRPLVWEPEPNPEDALGLYLLDSAGNRELLYRDPRTGSTNPCPLRPRLAPPLVAGNEPKPSSEPGEVFVADVYEGLGNAPHGTIESIRVIQIFPKTTPWANDPLVGIAGEENARAILGTVPVEEDGSARFLVPSRKPFLLQAIDADGFAYQTMRSLTYLQPGEQTSCIGCHENGKSAPPSRLGSRDAAQRPASRIEAGPFEGEPFSYLRMVQPILDRRCVRCHKADAPAGGVNLTGRLCGEFTESYWALCGLTRLNDAMEQGAQQRESPMLLVPRFPARNQIQVTAPGGQHGARGSLLIRMLREGRHHVRLDDAELRRIAAWIDCNATFYGATLPERRAAQRKGETIDMPDLQ